MWLLLALVAAGLLGRDRLEQGWNGVMGLADTREVGKPTPQLLGEVFGSMPKPTQPSISEPVIETLSPRTTRKVVVKRIPMIDPSMQMPHGYWGECSRCHLFRGGLPPGSQPITPVGKIWEKASTIKKVGPPILPDSPRPHPPSGRCIKCHDIVIEVPL